MQGSLYGILGALAGAGVQEMFVWNYYWLFLTRYMEKKKWKTQVSLSPSPFVPSSSLQSNKGHQFPACLPRDSLCIWGGHLLNEQRSWGKVRSTEKHS